MLEWLSKLPDKLYDALPEKWKSGIAKSAIILVIAVAIATIFIVAVAAAILAIELAIGRGVKFGFMEIPDRKIENCKTLSPHVQTIEDEVKKNQEEYERLRAKLTNYETRYTQIYVDQQNPKGAAESMQPLIDATRADIRTSEQELNDSMNRLRAAADKFIEGCAK